MAVPRRIIVSRKGFDSAYGGVASPIFPGGAMLSLPIPHAGAPHTYGHIRYNGESLGPLVEQLTHGRVMRTSTAHLDPDLRLETIARMPGWRPLFGQCGAAQTHLANSGVGSGDLFLFFGWFRAVEQQHGAWRFVRGAPDLHMIYGWLQIDEVLAIDDALPANQPWLAYHPHAHGSYGANNTIYTARPQLVIDGVHTLMPGAGVMTTFRQSLCLTRSGSLYRSEWELPSWCFPRAGITPFTYHHPGRWTHTGKRVTLASVPRGQEFVLHTDAYPEALSWVREMLAG